MRKFTFALILMLGFASLGMAQTIEDYENIGMNLFAQGSTGTLSVVPNPDPTGANTSGYVGKMVRAKDGDPWMGWYATLPAAVDMSANKYVHVLVWKPRVSPTCFKFEKDGGNSGDTYPIADATENGKWIEVVYDFSANAAVTGDYVKIVLIPDFLTPVGLTEDITLYFDNMYVNNDPTVGSAPVVVMEDFESIPMNLFAQGTTGSLSIVDNPDRSGVNLSNRVAKMVRAKDGDPWQGWYGHIDAPVKVAETRYGHVKVWKPRISPVCFKLEQGTGTPNATGDLFSTAPQATTNAWEDMVFDYGTFNGDFSQLVLIPDFENPLTVTEDFTMYFDDIRFNNDPNPMSPPEQIIQVDMNGAGLVAGDKVYLAGTLGGKYGTWQTPGENPNNELTDPDGDGVYTGYFHLADGVIAFKFFKTTADKPATWDFGDPFTGGDRTYTVNGSCNIIYTWGSGGVDVAVKEKPLAGKVNIYPNPVRNELTVNSTSDLRSATITSMVGKVVAKYAFNNSGVNTINTSNLSSGMYFVTFVGKDGNKVTQKLIKD